MCQCLILDTGSYIVLVCNILKFTSTHYISLIDAVAFRNAYFGRGSGPIYLDGVDCSGHEGNLIECPHSSFVSCPNNHYQDAGVRCQGRAL